MWSKNERADLRQKKKKLRQQVSGKKSTKLSKNNEA